MLAHPVGGGEMRLGSAEIVVKSSSGQVFVAPNLIVHYIEAHSYLPPREFVEAVLR